MLVPVEQRGSCTARHSSSPFQPSTLTMGAISMAQCDKVQSWKLTHWFCLVDELVVRHLLSLFCFRISLAPWGFSRTRTYSSTTLDTTAFCSRQSGPAGVQPHKKDIFTSAMPWFASVWPRRGSAAQEHLPKARELRCLFLFASVWPRRGSAAQEVPLH